MIQNISLTAADASISAWAQIPPQARVGVILVQEIFGANAHIRAVLADFAARGHAAIAPCFFDRIERGVELDYDEVGHQRGRALVGQLGFDGPLRDCCAAERHLRAQGIERVAVVGYCWGGAVAFLCATRLGLPAVSYYGRLVNQYLHERPQAPLLFHYGRDDALIPLSAVDGVRAALPEAELHVYPAGHAFNRLGDPAGHPDSAALALSRTLAFIEAQAR